MVPTRVSQGSSVKDGEIREGMPRPTAKLVPRPQRCDGRIHVTQGMSWSTMTRASCDTPHSVAGVADGRAAKSLAHRFMFSCGKRKATSVFVIGSVRQSLNWQVAQRRRKQ